MTDYTRIEVEQELRRELMAQAMGADPIVSDVGMDLTHLGGATFLKDLESSRRNFDEWNAQQVERLAREPEQIEDPLAERAEELRRAALPELRKVLALQRLDEKARRRKKSR